MVLVVTGKVAEANPCGTVTLEGTLAAAVLPAVSVATAVIVCMPFEAAAVFHV